MTHVSHTRWLITRSVSPWLLGALLLPIVGCVGQSTYEQDKAGMQERTRALAEVREELKALEQQLAELQKANQREEGVTRELRSAILREENLLPMRKQQADKLLSSLKTQIATLMNESWHLTQTNLDIRQESMSLQKLVARYTHKLEHQQGPLLSTSESNSVFPTQANLTAASPTATQPDRHATRMPLTQTTAAGPRLQPATQPSASPSLKADPPLADNSWISIISRWLTSIWKWLFG